MKEEIKKVIWRDISALPSGRWYTKETALKESQKLFETEYVTVGQIIEENENFIIISATWDSDIEEENFNDISMILKSVIVRIEPLN